MLKPAFKKIGSFEQGYYQIAETEDWDRGRGWNSYHSDRHNPIGAEGPSSCWCLFKAVLRCSYPFLKASLRDPYPFFKGLLRDSYPFFMAFLRCSYPFWKMPCRDCSYHFLKGNYRETVWEIWQFLIGFFQGCLEAIIFRGVLRNL